MPQLDRAAGYPDNRFNVILGVSAKMFLDEISV